MEELVSQILPKMLVLESPRLSNKLNFKTESEKNKRKRPESSKQEHVISPLFNASNKA